MYAKLVSLVGTGKDFTLCMQVVLYARTCSVCQAGWYR